MNILSLLGGGLVKEVGGMIAHGMSGITGVVGKVIGAKNASEHEENIERLRQAGSYIGENRTWWDSLVDGINRLVRPCFTFGTLFLFYLAVDAPTRFHAAMVALAEVPDPMWIILGTIVIFWFGEKQLKGLRRPKPASTKEVEGVLRNIRKIEELRSSKKKELENGSNISRN